MFHIKIYVVKAITYTNIMYCLWGFGADFMLRSPTSQEKQKFTVVAPFSKNHCNTLYNNESVNVAAFTMSDYNVQTKSFWALKQILDQVRHSESLFNRSPSSAQFSSAVTWPCSAVAIILITWSVNCSSSYRGNCSLSNELDVFPFYSHVVKPKSSYSQTSQQAAWRLLITTCL